MSDLNNGKRSDFLIQWYSILWSNINRSMEGIWKILAPITVVGSIFFAIYQDYLPASLGISLAFLIIFWALNMTIDLSKWHRRNLIFLTKIENEFLLESDYGRIMPKRYKEPKTSWVKFYIINGYVFCAVLAICLIYSITLKKDVSLPYHWFIFGVGCLLTGYNYFKQEKSINRHFKEFFPKNRE